MKFFLCCISLVLAMVCLTSSAEACNFRLSRRDPRIERMQVVQATPVRVIHVQRPIPVVTRTVNGVRNINPFNTTTYYPTLLPRVNAAAGFCGPNGCTY